MRRLVITVNVLLAGCATPATVATGSKAAMIDQLDGSGDGRQFKKEISDILAQFGLTVDVFQGDCITLDLLRNLPVSGYKVVIFRVHSGALRQESNKQAIDGTYLLTNELYTERKYVPEQLSDHMAITRASETDPYVFAVGSKFVTKSMKGLQYRLERS